MAVDPFIQDIEDLKNALESVNKEFKTTVMIDINEIRRIIAEESKRETQGRSTYARGVR